MEKEKQLVKGEREDQGNLRKRILKKSKITNQISKQFLKVKKEVQHKTRNLNSEIP